MLSDINFTSMVPELSRSADHLCQHQQDENGDPNRSPNYCKGNLLRTPEVTKGIPPSFSMTSPGVSQWTVNESSIATQTTQTDALWTNRGDSFDSSKSYSAGSRYSTLSKHHRSRSVPSMRCAICRQTHHNTALRPSESMHYTPRVTFQEQPVHKIRGSLPDLRHDCNCPRRYGGPSLYRIHGDSGGSTDSLLEEAEEFLRRSLEGGNMLAMEDSLGQLDVGVPPPATAGLLPHVTFHGHAGHAHPALHHPTAKHRRCSENDIQRDYIPSKQALPFLPKTPKCLKPGHLAKVISPTGRVIVGRVRYIGPVAGTDSEDTYVGLQLPNNLGDCDGTIDGKRFFECEPLHGIFVPFKKVVMAWNS
uniref:CAP-Gly domain-containing protein n=1 Tax=Anopheles stephensi TaxID=30069 RepID=A0A182Y6X7_ANOST